MTANDKKKNNKELAWMREEELDRKGLAASDCKRKYEKMSKICWFHTIRKKVLFSFDTRVIDFNEREKETECGHKCEILSGAKKLAFSQIVGYLILIFKIYFG